MRGCKFENYSSDGSGLKSTLWNLNLMMWNTTFVRFHCLKSTLWNLNSKPHFLHPSIQLRLKSTLWNLNPRIMHHRSSFCMCLKSTLWNLNCIRASMSLYCSILSQIPCERVKSKFIRPSFHSYMGLSLTISPAWPVLNGSFYLLFS